MSSRIVTIALPEETMAYLQWQADASGMSVEAWILRELELQRKLQEETDTFFAERASRAVPGSWRDALANRPATPPTPGDELPEPHRI